MDWFSFIVCGMIWGILVLVLLIIVILFISFLIFLRIRGFIKQIQVHCNLCGSWLKRSSIEFILGNKRHIVISNSNFRVHESDKYIEDFEKFSEESTSFKDFLYKADGQFSGNKSKFFQESFDCPICMVPFMNEDNITNLKCNKMHVYHTDCLNEMLSFDSIERKCLLCRNVIQIDQ